MLEHARTYDASLSVVSLLSGCFLETPGIECSLWSWYGPELLVFADRFAARVDQLVFVDHVLAIKERTCEMICEQLL